MGERKPSGVREIHIENSILDYLMIRQIFCWKARTVGTWDVNKSVFRRRSKRYMVGVADIVGIYKGVPLAIEVKTGNGYLRPDQKAFITRFIEEGGLAFVARGPEDVEARLAEFDALKDNAKHVASVPVGGKDLVSGALGK